MEEQRLRQDIIDACRRMNACGINQGTSGNVAVRWRDGLLITPSGLPYERMAPEDIVFLDMNGRPEGRNRPSSEWRIHRDILEARQEVDAVVHAHPTYCTILSIRRQEIPAIHYMIAAAGGATGVVVRGHRPRGHDEGSARWPPRAWRPPTGRGR